MWYPWALKITKVETAIFTVNRISIVVLFGKNKPPPKSPFYNVFISYNSGNVRTAVSRETIEETGSTSFTRSCSSLNSSRTVSYSRAPADV